MCFDVRVFVVRSTTPPSCRSLGAGVLLEVASTLPAGASGAATQQAVAALVCGDAAAGQERCASSGGAEAAAQAEAREAPTCWGQ